MSTSAVLRAAALSAAALVFAVACTDGSGDVDEPEIVDADYVAVGSAEDFDPEESVAAGENRPGWLIGPTFWFGLVGHSVVAEASAEQAAAFGLDSGPAAAPEGHEFLVAAFDPESAPGENAEAVLHVDGREHDMEELPEGAQTIAAVVPADASVLLEVSEEGRSQTLDLRTGERPEEILGFYNAEPISGDPADYDEVGVATADPGSDFLTEEREIRLKLSLGSAERSPWSPEQGWAEDGKVWVSAPISDMRTDAVWGFEDGSSEPMIFWTLDQEDLFTLEAGEDDDLKPQGGLQFRADREQLPVDGAFCDFDPPEAVLVFAVDETATTMLLEVAPGGELSAEWGNTEGEAEWDEEPEAAVSRLEF